MQISILSLNKQDKKKDEVEETTQALPDSCASCKPKICTQVSEVAVQSRNPSCLHNKLFKQWLSYSQSSTAKLQLQVVTRGLLTSRLNSFSVYSVLSKIFEQFLVGRNIHNKSILVMSSIDALVDVSHTNRKQQKSTKH